MKHARCSPSNYKRWMTCPGAITLQEKLGNLIPPDEGSSAANLGTELHARAEAALKGEGEPCEATQFYVDYCRQAAAADDAVKKQLPAVIISADTTHRKVHPDDTRTGLLLMDVDGKDHPDMLMDEMKASVQEMCDKYSYVIGYCLSPSWKGLKVLCGIDPSEDTHLRSFMSLEQVFASHGIIVDRGCKDLKRVNFLCHDPMVESTLTAPLEAWGGEVVEPMPVKQRKQYKMGNISSGSDLTPDDEAQLCLQHISPDIDYADWVSVGMALKSHGCSCATWDAWSAGAQSYKQGECERKWNGFSGSGVGFGSGQLFFDCVSLIFAGGSQNFFCQSLEVVAGSHLLQHAQERH